jgi:hypothetical protein
MPSKSKALEKTSQPEAAPSHAPAARQEHVFPQRAGNGLWGLQAGAGNLAVQRLLQSRAIQAKLAINPPGDECEQEADRVAETVMRMPDSAVSGLSHSPPAVQRKCAACASGGATCPKCAEEEEKVQRKPLAAGITPLV